MSDWQEASLADLAEYINGRAIKPEECSSAQGIPIIRIKQINDPQSIEDRFCGDDLEEKNIARNGDLLFSWSATLKTILWQGPTGAINQHIFKVLPKEGIDKTFLHYLIEYSMPALAEESHGSTMKHIKKSALSAFRLQVPPLPEQKKIAEILSGVDQGLISLRKKKQKVENIYRACSSDLFGSVSSQVPLNDICDLQVGFPFRSTDFRDDGIRLLRGENVGYGKPDWERSQFLPPSLVESGSQYHLNAGDIVIGMDRSFTKQGFKVSRISQGDLPCLLVQRVGRFMPKGITGSYLWHILQSVQYQAILSTSEKGMDIPHLSKSEILEPLVPLADDEQQAQICTCLDSLTYSLSAINCSIKIIAQLAIALRLDLLSGRKRVTV
jgi:type I restriction enzyme S subunit